MDRQCQSELATRLKRERVLSWCTLVNAVALFGIATLAEPGSPAQGALVSG